MANRTIVKGQIGNALHSVAPDHITTTAYEVFDETQQEYQDALNAGFIAATGYYECSTSAATAAKTVAATGYILTNGGCIKVKMTNANTADAVTLNINSTGAKDLYYQGAQANAGNSWEAGEVLEVYYDGTNYQAKNVAGGDGDGAFDVSARNGGVHYASFADAVAAVPVSKRKAGMSIKFIQLTPATYNVAVTTSGTQPTGTALSSASIVTDGTYTASQLTDFATLPSSVDSSSVYYFEDSGTYTIWTIVKSTSDVSEYVQYRYMNSTYTNTIAGNAAFDNIVNWQGVDTEPTSGSHNLVESGGVEKFIIKNVAEINYTSIIEGKRIYQGKLTTKNNYDTYSFPVEGGKIVYVELNKGSVEEALGFMDADDNMIAINLFDGSITSGARTHVYVLVPDNATKMLVSESSTDPLPIAHSTNIDLSNLKQFFEKATPIETLDGYYVNTNGELREVEDRITETYSVKAGDIYFIDVKSLSDRALVFAFYNSDTPSADTYIPNVSLVGDTERRKIQVIVPTGAVRMRICHSKNTLNYRSVYYAEGIDLANYPVIAGLLSSVAGVQSDVTSLSSDVTALENTVNTLVGISTIKYSESDLTQGYYDTRHLAVGDAIYDYISGKTNPDVKCGKFTVNAGDTITICTSTKPSSGGRPYVLTDLDGIVVELSELGGDCTTPSTINVVEDGILYVCEKLSSMTGYTFSVEIQRLSDNVILDMQKQIDTVNARIFVADKVLSYDDTGFDDGYYYAPSTLSVGDTYVERIGGKDDENLLCKRLDVKSGDVVTLCTSMGTGSPSSKARPYFLTDLDRVITVLTPTGSNTFPSATFTVENDGYLYVSEKLSVMGDYTFSLKIKRKFDYSTLPNMRDDIDKLKEGVIVDDDVPLSVVKETPGMTAILHRIGVVGASLTNGGHNTTDGSFPTEAGREYSWPQRLARLCGITCFNFGANGYWCKRWLDNVGGYYEAIGEPENKCDAYIISFASNDIYSKSGYYVGTIEDVHVGNESENGDSYYGYLSKVIARCHEVQERAYLFVLTYPAGFGETESGGYTQAMRDIVELYRDAGYNIYLIDYAAYGMTTSEANKRGFKRSAHYVADGYQYMTYEICTYIDWIIRHNIEDFKDAAFVRTTAEYYGKNLLEISNDEAKAQFLAGKTYIIGGTKTSMKIDGATIDNPTPHGAEDNLWEYTAISDCELQLMGYDSSSFVVEFKNYNRDDYFIGPNHNKYLNIDYRRPRFYYTKDEIDAMLADTSSRVPTKLSDLTNDTGFITKSVNDLTNYYLKSETYTKDEVAALIAALQQFHYEVYASTSEVTDPQSNVLYLIGPSGSGSDQYEEYVYPNSTLGFVKIGDTSIDLSGYVTTTALNTALANYTTTTELEVLLAEKANVNGTYPSLVAGKAENLVGEPIPVTTGYTLKATGYDPSQPELEFADGQVKMTEIQGRACAWNQLVKPINSTNWSSVDATAVFNNEVCSFTASERGGCIRSNVIEPAITNHKFFVTADINATNGVTLTIRLFGGYYVRDIIGTGQWTRYSDVKVITGIAGNYVEVRDYRYSEWDEIQVRNYMLIDLTLLCPHLASKANLTVAEVEAYLASIRTPKPYIKENAGTLLGARMMGWQLRKTANLLNPTTKQAKLFEYAYTGHGNEYTVNGWDELTNAALQFTPYNTGVAGTVTLDANNRFVIPSAGVLEVIEATAGTTITGDVSRVCVVATWDGSMDDVYSAYEEDNVEIDSANIYYDNNGIKTQVFEGGVMRSTGDDTTDVHDRVYFDEVAKKWKAEVNVGDVDLGTLEDWRYIDNNGCVYAAVPGMSKCSSTGDASNVICNKYSTIKQIGLYSPIADKSVCKRALNTNADIMVKDSTYTSAPTSQDNWVNGIHLWFEKATPVTHDTLYYKVGNDYVPMEQVFPNGIQRYCCNWASENLVEQAEVDGQPQSITPITTEVFQSDYKELLKTIGDTYVSKEQAKDSFDNLLSALNTNSGSALGGTYATDGFNSDGSVKFTFTPAT